VFSGCVLSTFGKMARGAWAFFRNIWAHGLKDIEFQSFYGLKN